MEETSPELYVRKKGQVSGPYSFEDLQQFAERGKLSRIHQVSEDGVSWITAGKYQPSIWEKFAAPTPQMEEHISHSTVEAPPGESAGNEDELSVHAEDEYKVALEPAKTNSAEIQVNSSGWYYTQNERELGPIDLSELMQMFLNGDLDQNEEVWVDGMHDWEPAYQVPQLQNCFRSRTATNDADAPKRSFDRNRTRGRSSQKKNDDNPLYWYGAVWKQFVNFNGRARRKEYWYFTLCNVIVLILLNVISALIGDYNGLLGGIYNLAILLPGLGVLARRLHDTDRSGWWMLIMLVPIVGFIVLLVFLIQEGDSGENQYGDDPIE